MNEIIAMQDSLIARISDASTADEYRELVTSYFNFTHEHASALLRQRIAREMNNGVDADGEGNALAVVANEEATVVRVEDDDTEAATVVVDDDDSSSLSSIEEFEPPYVESALSSMCTDEQLYPLVPDPLDLPALQRREIDWTVFDAMGDYVRQSMRDRRAHGQEERFLAAVPNASTSDIYILHESHSLRCKSQFVELLLRLEIPFVVLATEQTRVQLRLLGTACAAPSSEPRGTTPASVALVADMHRFYANVRLALAGMKSCTQFSECALQHFARPEYAFPTGAALFAPSLGACSHAHDTLLSLDEAMAMFDDSQLADFHRRFVFGESAPSIKAMFCAKSGLFFFLERFHRYLRDVRTGRYSAPSARCFDQIRDCEMPFKFAARRFVSLSLETSSGKRICDVATLLMCHPDVDPLSDHYYAANDSAYGNGVERAILQRLWEQLPKHRVFRLDADSDILELAENTELNAPCSACDGWSRELMDAARVSLLQRRVRPVLAINETTPTQGAPLRPCMLLTQDRALLRLVQLALMSATRQVLLPYHIDPALLGARLSLCSELRAHSARWPPANALIGATDREVQRAELEMISSSCQVPAYLESLLLHNHRRANSFVRANEARMWTSSVRLHVFYRHTTGVQFGTCPVPTYWNDAHQFLSLFCIGTRTERYLRNQCKELGVAVKTNGDTISVCDSVVDLFADPSDDVCCKKAQKILSELALYRISLFFVLWSLETTPERRRGLLRFATGADSGFCVENALAAEIRNSMDMSRARRSFSSGTEAPSIVAYKLDLLRVQFPPNDRCNGIVLSGELPKSESDNFAQVSTCDRKLTLRHAAESYPDFCDMLNAIADEPADFKGARELGPIADAQ